MRQFIGSALVRVMAYRISGAKPLSKPMLGNYQGTYRLRNGGHFIQGWDELTVMAVVCVILPAVMTVPRAILIVSLGNKYATSFIYTPVASGNHEHTAAYPGWIYSTELCRQQLLKWAYRPCDEDIFSMLRGCIARWYICHKESIP